MLKTIIIVCLGFFFLNVTHATILKGTLKVRDFEQTNGIQGESVEYLLTVENGAQVSLSVSPALITSAGGISRLINQRVEISVNKAQQNNDALAD
jgi:hypothetical protein